jgi:enoyl-[acyl-carrier-protein] reductase (NADH)
LLFPRLLANLLHGGSPPYGNPIFRSGEVCRHSKINSAQDISPRGIRVNAVAPGVIETDATGAFLTPEGREGIIGSQALKRIGQPDDVADVVAFLGSNAARWITGDIIQVGGGSKL